MASNTGKLTAVAIKGAKPGDKARRLFDGGGLYLEIAPSGARYWRQKYRFAGKEKRLSHGVFPEVSLSAARERRDAARADLQAGRDPGLVKRVTRMQSALAASTTFEAIGADWLEKQRKSYAAATFKKSGWLIDQVTPYLGVRPIAEIEPPELLAVLRRIESRGARETAHRALDKCNQIFRYAIASGLASRNPAADLRGALAPVVGRNHPALTEPKAIGALLRAIDGYEGQESTRCALRLAPLLFTRPGELRKAEWDEFDLEASEWHIPGHKMKTGNPHIVPLATQALSILRELQPLTGKKRYLFPNLNSADAPMSENTINAALRRMGYDKDTMTGHGFRALASTRLNEMGFDEDVIERQLAHVQRNKVRRAYNRAKYLPERKRMMQAWADYLDQLRSGKGKVIAFKRAKGA